MKRSNDDFRGVQKQPNTYFDIADLYGTQPDSQDVQNFKRFKESPSSPCNVEEPPKISSTNITNLYHDEDAAMYHSSPESLRDSDLYETNSNAKISPLAKTEAVVTEHKSGFERANGKTVDISDEARKKAHSLLEQSQAGIESNSVSFLSPAVAPVTPSGFQRANGKAVTISEESKRRGMMLLSSADVQQAYTQTDTSEINTAETYSKPSGFQRASGKTVVISEEAKRRGQELLSLANPQQLSTLATSSHDKKLSISSGFQHTNGSAIVISEESRSKNNSLLSTSSVPGRTTSTSALIPESRDIFPPFLPSERQSSSLLRKANGQSVTISEAAKQKAVAIFDSTKSSPTPAESTLAISHYSSTANSSSRSSFQKASGGSVVISEEAKQRGARILQQNIEPRVPSESSSNASSSALVIGSNSHAQAQATSGASSLLRKANGGQVVISESARNRASAIFDSNQSSSHISAAATSVPPVLQPLNAINSDSSSTAVGSSMSASGGFQRASGKKVEISDEARNRAAQFLAADKTPASLSNIIPTATSSSSSVFIAPSNFSSASSSFNISTNQNSKAYSGGNTTSLLRKANGGVVTISEEAKIRSAAILQQTANSTFTNPSTSADTTVASATVTNMQPIRSLDQQFALVDNHHMRDINNNSTASEKSSTKLESSNISPLDDSAVIAILVKNAIENIHFDSSRRALLAISPGTTNVNTGNETLNSTSHSWSVHHSKSDDSLLTIVPSVTDKQLRNDHWQQNVDLFRRYSTLLRFNSGNVLDMIGQLDNSLHNLADFTKDTFSVKLVAQLKLSVNVQTNLSHYVPEIDTMDKGHWKRKQLQWIVWSLVGHERTTPELYLGRLVTLEVILDGLVHRYHRFQRHISKTSADLSTLTHTNPLATTTDKRSDKQNLQKSKHVSALQRFQEICDWAWPLCVTISIQKSIVWGNSADLSESSYAKSAMKSTAVPKTPSSSVPTKGSGPYANTVTPAWHQDAGAIVKEDWKLEITDGWWWIRIVLDPPLLNLIREKKLIDGTKIVIFSAKFNQEDNSFVTVTYHNLHRAHRLAPLGQVPKSLLTRGLSFPAFRPDGGIIFGAQFYVLARTSQVGIAFLNTNSAKSSSSGIPQTPISSGHQAQSRVFISETEAEHFLERVQERWMMQQDESWHRAIQNGDMDEEDIAYYSARGGYGNSKDNDMMSEVSMVRSTGLLVQCCHSGQLAWIVVNGSGTGGESGGGGGGGKQGTDDQDQTWSIGGRYFMTNITPSKRTASGPSMSPLLLHQTRSSTFTMLKTPPPTNASPPSYLFQRKQKDIGQEKVHVVSRYGVNIYDQLPLSLLQSSNTMSGSSNNLWPRRSSPASTGKYPSTPSMKLESSSSNINVVTPAAATSVAENSPPLFSTLCTGLLGTYLSISVTIVDVYNKSTGESIFAGTKLVQSQKKTTAPGNTNAAKSRNSSDSSFAQLFEESSLRIVCIDPYGSVIDVHGTWFTAQLSSLRWLKPHELRIRLDHVLVSSVDAKYAIIRVEKTEHSMITIISESTSSAVLKQRTPSSVTNNAHKGQPQDWNPPYIQWRGIEEQLRMKSLQQNQETYLSQWQLHLKDDAQNAVNVKIVPVSLQCQVFHLRNMQCRDPVLLTPDEISTNTLGVRLWMHNEVYVVKVLVDYDTFLDTSEPLCSYSSSNLNQSGDEIDLRRLPWSPIIQPSELLPTHMFIHALYVCPVEPTSSNNKDSALLAAESAQNMIMKMKMNSLETSSSDKMGVLYDMMVQLVAHDEHSAGPLPVPYHLVIKQLSVCL